MALTDPDIFSQSADAPAVAALLTSLPQPPKGKGAGAQISGAFPVPTLHDPSERSKEMNDLRAERRVLQGQLRNAMGAMGQRQPMGSATPSLARQIIEQSSRGGSTPEAAPLPEDAPMDLPSSGSTDTGNILTNAPPPGSTTDENLFPVKPEEGAGTGSLGGNTDDDAFGY